MQRRKDALWAVGTLAGSVLFPWYAVTGLQSGVVKQFSRGSTVLHRASEPGWYWLNEGLWLMLACLSLAASVSLAVRAWRHSPSGRAGKKAALAHKAAAQTRDVEVGKGPEPPWVRFPVGADAPPEAALEAYMQDIFLPFWEPLGAEARAAYLRRNPPPDAEWRQAMAAL